MITKPMDILAQFPVRKSKKQKAVFRQEVETFARNRGYDVKIENGTFGAHNIVIGNPDTAKYLVTAHYDTPASIGIPNFITPCNVLTFLLYQFLVVGLLLAIAFGCGFAVNHFTGSSNLSLYVGYFVYMGILVLMMFGPANKHNANDNTSGVVTVLELLSTLPEDKQDTVCFVLFDLEEAGLIGSASFRKAHKTATDRQLVINLDCVGDGDHLVMFPNPKLRKNPEKMVLLDRLCRTEGHKTLQLHQKGFAYCPSDHKNFPNSAGVMAFHNKKGIGLYCGRIHTYRDTILDQKNVYFLTDALLALICE